MKKIIFVILAWAMLLSLAACGGGSKPSSKPYVPGTLFDSGTDNEESDTSPGTPGAVHGADDASEANDAAAVTESTSQKPEHFYLPVAVYSNDKPVMTCDYDSAGHLTKYSEYENNLAEYDTQINFSTDSNGLLIPTDYRYIMPDKSYNEYKITDSTVSQGKITELKYEMYGKKIAGDIVDSLLESGTISAVYDEDGTLLNCERHNEKRDNYTHRFILDEEEYHGISVEVIAVDAENRPLNRKGTHISGVSYDEYFEYDANGDLVLYTYKYRDHVWEFAFDENGCLTTQSYMLPGGEVILYTYHYQAFPREGFEGKAIDYSRLIDREYKEEIDERDIMTSLIPDVVRREVLRMGDSSYYMEFVPN